MPSACREGNLMYARYILVYVHLVPGMRAEIQEERHTFLGNHVIDIDGQGVLLRTIRTLPRLHRLQNARVLRESAISRVLKRVAHVCEGRMMLGDTTRARSLHVDFCQGYVAYAYVYPDPSSAIVSIAVKQRNLDAEIIGSAFSICSKLNRLRDGRAKNASTRLSSSIEWIARSTPRTRSRFDERLGVFGKNACPTSIKNGYN